MSDEKKIEKKIAEAEESGLKHLVTGMEGLVVSVSNLLIAVKAFEKRLNDLEVKVETLSSVYTKKSNTLN